MPNVNPSDPIKTPLELIAEWTQAYNRHDATAAAALYCEDATNIQAPWTTPIQGRDGMLKTFIRTLQAFPDIHLEIENVRADGDWVTLEWVFSGTMLGEFAGSPPTGRRFTMRGCEVFQIREGQIQTQHGYWDKATMFDQVGLGSKS